MVCGGFWSQPRLCGQNLQRLDMAISVTWANIFVLVGLLIGILTAFGSGTATMMNWRMEALQNQLSDRMTQYSREMQHLEKRIDKLESR